MTNIAYSYLFFHIIYNFISILYFLLGANFIHHTCKSNNWSSKV